MSPCVWRGNGAVLRAKPPLVEANVACTTTETDCLCCHSFTLSLSGSANGDINQSVDTHAEAVMCHHTEWAEDGWHIPTRGILYIRDRRLISRMQFKQVSTVDGFKFRLHGRLAKNLIKLRATGGEFLSCLIGVTQKWISEWCCRKKKKMMTTKAVCWLHACSGPPATEVGHGVVKKHLSQSLAGKTGSRYFCWSPTALMEQRQVAFQKIYK